MACAFNLSHLVLFFHSSSLRATSTTGGAGFSPSLISSFILRLPAITSFIIKLWNVSTGCGLGYWVGRLGGGPVMNYTRVRLFQLLGRVMVGVPTELLCNVFQYADGDDLRSYSCVCKEWYLIACRRSLWRSACRKKWPHLRPPDVSATYCSDWKALYLDGSVLFYIVAHAT